MYGIIGVGVGVIFIYSREYDVVLEIFKELEKKGKLTFQEIRNMSRDVSFSYILYALDLKGVIIDYEKGEARY